MKTFYLQRDGDISGISGTGIVAEGVEFDNGMVVLAWLGVLTSLGIYLNIEDMLKIHGHEGRTKIVYQPNN